MANNLFNHPTLSDFEKRVLRILVKGDPEESIISSQIEEVRVTSREHTGVGLFVNLSVSEHAPTLRTSNRYIETTPKVHLDHPELSNGAGAMLWFAEGRISCLECYSYGNSWPTDESLFVIHSNAINV